MHDHLKGGALTETTFFILLAAWEPNHGYGMMQFVERATGGRLHLGAGMLYGAIDTLVRKGWLAPCGETGRRRTYRITEAGREAARAELARLRKLVQTARGIMEGETLL